MGSRLDSLAGEHAAKLSTQTEAALRRRRRALADALEKSLEHIPRMLRGPARRHGHAREDR